jgi:hypothetical protein
MAKYEKRFYKIIASNDDDYSDIDLTSGQTLHITNIGANTPPSIDTKAEIVIDPLGTPEILLACHGNTVQNIVDKEIIGPKKIRLRLYNDSDQSEEMGSFVQGELYE